MSVTREHLQTAKASSTSTLLSAEPHSSAAERTVIGALLLDGERIFEVAPRLQPDAFYDPVLRQCYQAMVDLMGEGSVIDFVTVSARLESCDKVQALGGSAFLAELTAQVPTASHIQKYADILHERYQRRQLLKLGKALEGLATSDDTPTGELIETAEREFLKLSQEATTSEPIRIGDLGGERYEQYAKLFEGDDSVETGVKTGFPELDDMLVTLQPGQLIYLAGRPGMGKTAMALDIARQVAVEQQNTVAVFSLEMTKEEIFDRLFAASLGVEAWKVGKGMMSEEQFAQMGPVMDQLAQYPLYIDDDADTELSNLRSKARRFQMRHGLDLLIIDYLQLIEVSDRVANENQTQRVTYISKSLKRLARELCCPVMALSQLSRECEKRADKRPLLSDLRESGGLEQDGDRILMLYREGEYNPDCEQPNQTDVFVRKNRQGRKGEVSLWFDEKRMSFREK